MREAMREVVRLEGVLFAVALARLTRFQPAASRQASDDLVVRAQRYHPLVAALAGGAAGCVLAALGLVLPGAAAVLVAWAVLVWLMRGRGPLGVARVAEALSAGKGAAGTLGLLDVPWIGASGALALGLVIGMQVVLLAEIFTGASWHAAAATLVLGQGLGAMAAMHIRAAHIPARASGVEVHAFGATPDGYRVALASVLILAVPLVLSAGPAAGIGALIGAVGLGQAFREAFQRRIGGYTEACLGGIHEVAALGATLGATVGMAIGGALG